MLYDDLAVRPSIECSMFNHDLYDMDIPRSQRLNDDWNMINPDTGQMSADILCGILNIPKR
jgi:hypothetical protein